MAPHLVEGKGINVIHHHGDRTDQCVLPLGLETVNRGGVRSRQPEDVPLFPAEQRLSRRVEEVRAAGLPLGRQHQRVKATPWSINHAFATLRCVQVFLGNEPLLERHDRGPRHPFGPRWENVERANRMMGLMLLGGSEIGVQC